MWPLLQCFDSWRVATFRDDDGVKRHYCVVEHAGDMGYAVAVSPEDAVRVAIRRLREGQALVPPGPDHDHSASPRLRLVL